MKSPIRARAYSVPTPQQFGSTDTSWFGFYALLIFSSNTFLAHTWLGKVRKIVSYLYLNCFRTRNTFLANSIKFKLLKWPTIIFDTWIEASATTTELTNINCTLSNIILQNDKWFKYLYLSNSFLRWFFFKFRNM